MGCVNRVFVSVLAFGLWSIQPTRLLANDSSVAWSAGGLQFQRTAEVRMEHEELYLSPLEVRVSYVFRNLTDHDVRMRVAFPMPDIAVGAMAQATNTFHFSSRDGDVFDFHVLVNGLEIVSDLDARAYKGDQPDKEVTAILKKYKMPLLTGIAGEDRDEDKPDMKMLLAEGLLVKYGDGFLYSNWIVKPNFHWEQLFPASQTIEITHRYKPVTGGSNYFSTDLDPTKPSEWCFDEAFASALKKLPGKTINAGFDDLRYDAVADLRLEYILKTGANWAGPIGKFRLEINKDGADLLSLCPIPGLKLARHGQSFVAEASQYVPTSDIKLLFVYRACAKAPRGP